ncbi:hypothetical protein SCH01S_03_00690 [Sphingomonas changbaiensis NBRC 104936]|uniref:PNPLA domain-containing protein n=1 Tax=Sphingomonas changbaiensis NBRC 104936 TaxID=1219043 RepID=A0A0E9MKN1_9SPHN|nr:patatin-like phospholipase family protein [Sphingomonas changbaiensis]GAO38094.1 hypothetical protein SCH01S_03_00690 [Sphingomonas changbaiensis NBRC 104936]
MIESTTTGEALPKLECDIVMRGGVTSGIVYPGAVVEIARLYRLRSIGGTSVGAIAAAAAAAMEYGRLTGSNPNALNELGRLPHVLGEEEDGRTKLERLLVPTRQTRPLFNLLWRMVAGDRSTPHRAKKRMFNFATIAKPVAASVVGGASLATLLAWFDPATGAWQAVDWTLAALVGTPAVGGLLAWRPGRKIWRAMLTLPKNGFGLCPGIGPNGTGLIDWTHAQLQALAGLPITKPLTFGDLWTARKMDGRAIDLTVIASDLTRGKLIQLPFLSSEDEIYARRSELRKVLPSVIVNAMAAAPAKGISPDARAANGGQIDGDLFRLPAPEHMPVLFATRLSMSFPLLFQAVPLHLLRRRGKGMAPELVPLWFSDGGITSNFPIHLFDAPLPTRPTFCVNLLDPNEEFERPESVLALACFKRPRTVYMAADNQSRIALINSFWRGSPFQQLQNFGWRIVDTARQWNDYSAMDVPGYRDRIVHIGLGDNEGGLQFNMNTAMIEHLDCRGRAAGRVIAERLHENAKTDPIAPGKPLKLGWDNHRFVRLRAYIAGLELAAAKFGTGWTDNMRALVVSAVRSGESAHYLGYRFVNQAQRQVAEDFSDAVAKLAAMHPKGITTDFVGDLHTSPRPKPVLRLRPPYDGDPASER